MFMKLPFQQVVIHLKPNPNERVMPVSLLALRADQKFSECTTFIVLAIPACRNLWLTWFLIRWDGNFVELLNIQKICCYLLLRSSWTLMRTISSCELIRGCQWFRSCGLRSVLLCILGFKVITIDSPASSISPMVCSMVLSLPKASGSKEAPVLCVDDQSGLFLWLHSTRSFLSIPWRRWVASWFL